MLLRILLSRLEQAVPGAGEIFADWLHNASELARFRMSPQEWGDEYGLDGDQALHILLEATHVGLLQLAWELVCPGCGLLVDSLDSLGDVKGHFRCGVCLNQKSVALDDWIHVRFNVPSSVRPNRYFQPETLTLKEQLLVCRVGREVALRDGQPLVDHIGQGLVLLEELSPGETKTCAFDAIPGLLIVEPGQSVDVVEEEDAPTHLQIYFDEQGALHGLPESVAAGPVTVEIENQGSHKRQTWWFASRDGFRFGEPTALTAAEVVHHPTFARLFPAELETAGGIQIRSVTLLFTDLVGSSAMYRELGDLVAYERVRAHFTILARILSECNGLWIKTMGDAVMASFRDPSQAMRAAVRMQNEVADMSVSPPLRLRVGVHRGPCICVHGADRMDWFGNTVNVAARVQSAARPGEVCVSQAVMNALPEETSGEPFLDSYSVRLAEQDVVVYRVPATDALGPVPEGEELVLQVAAPSAT